MERVQRDSRDRDTDRGEAAAAPRTAAPSSASGASDGGTPLSSATGATADAGWEADVSLLAALGIFVGPAKPGKPGGDGHHAGGHGGQAKPGAQPGALPGTTTPPKGQPQGKVTPEIKKELENKKEAKARASTGQAPGGAAGAQPTAGAQAAGGESAVPAGQGNQGDQAGAGSSGASGTPGAPNPSGSGGGDPDPTEARNVERLIAILDNDSDPTHRRAALHALGKLRSAQARAALEKATRDKDPSIAKAAAASLAEH